ncbi:hypothetical protein DFH28DRAFT_1130770 [Melampsora americana]|nr:hypothetical protein DFH28DRAFT_1130770 [Melampsora americana]
MPLEDELAHIKTAIRSLMKAFPKNISTIPFSVPTHRFPFGGGLPDEDQDQKSSSNAPDFPLGVWLPGGDVHQDSGTVSDANIKSVDISDIKNQEEIYNKPPKEDMVTANTKAKPLKVTKAKPVKDTKGKPLKVTKAKHLKVTKPKPLQEAPNKSKCNKSKWKGWVTIEDEPALQAKAEAQAVEVEESEGLRPRRKRQRHV